MLVKASVKTDPPEQHELSNPTVEAAWTGRLCIEYSYSRRLFDSWTESAENCWATRSGRAFGRSPSSSRGTTGSMLRSNVTIGIRTLFVAVGVPEKRGSSGAYAGCARPLGRALGGESPCSLTRPRSVSRRRISLPDGRTARYRLWSDLIAESKKIR